LLADLLRRHHPQDRIARFSFRGLRPAFHGRRLTLEAWQDGEQIMLRSLDADGAVCMTAEVMLTLNSR
jgi:hydroxyacyl-ACP dehydratase HTD2-like protein with hotdog domain